MSRYVPTAFEQASIDRLTLAGYAVVRQRTYDRLRERVRIAEVMQGWEREQRESTEKWAQGEFLEHRRVLDRLTFVYGMARAAGVSVEELSGP